MQTHCPAASRFTILDELRSHFPAVQSLLTDQATALSARALWTEEVMPLKRDLARLTLDEEALYKNVRLEQERIPSYLPTILVVQGLATWSNHFFCINVTDPYAERLPRDVFASTSKLPQTIRWHCINLQPGDLIPRKASS